MPPRADRTLRHPGFVPLPVALATGAMVVFAAWTWAGMWSDPPAAAIAVAVACGAAPVVVSLLPIRAAGPAAALTAVLAGVVLAGVAADVSLTRLLTARGDAWTAVARILDDGVGEAARVELPLSSGEFREVAALLIVLIGMSAFLICAVGLVTRSGPGVLVTTGVAVAYRWTLVTPERAVLLGLAFSGLAITCLAAFASVRSPGPRHAVRTVVLGAATLGIAAVAAAGAADDGAWWDWRSWSWGSAGGEPTVLSLTQSYGPLEYPPQPIELATVATDRLTSLRAVALRRFDGIAFTDAPAVTVDVQRVTGELRTGADDAAADVTQRVRLTGTRSPWLFTTGEVTSVTGLGGRTATILDDGSVQVSPALEQDTGYAFRSRLVDPGAQALLAVPGYAGGSVAPEYLRLSVGDGSAPLDVPLFGTGEPPPPEAFGPYADVARLSRRVIGSSSTPYEAVNRVERFLRDAPFRYDERVQRPIDRPDLVAFLLDTRTGYCQQFAGSMALMLRMNGIPARVAVGFAVSAARYDAADEVYTVTDRDAHSWVEVFFPGYGWLPFDPTPGRSAANSASVSSIDYRLPEGPVEVVSELGQAPIQAAPPPVREPQEPAPAAPTPSGGSSRAPLILGAIALAVVLLLSPVAVKGLRRLRRRRGDARRRTLGAVRELESLLTDVGLAPDPAATPRERADTVARALGIDAGRIYGLARAARFSPEPPTIADARAAWSDVRAARRRLGWRTRVAAALSTRSLRTPRDGN